MSSSLALRAHALVLDGAVVYGLSIVNRRRITSTDPQIHSCCTLPIRPSCPSAILRWDCFAAAGSCALIPGMDCLHCFVLWYDYDYGLQLCASRWSCASDADSIHTVFASSSSAAAGPPCCFASPAPSGLRRPQERAEAFSSCESICTASPRSPPSTVRDNVGVGACTVHLGPGTVPRNDAKASV